MTSQASTSEEDIPSGPIHTSIALEEESHLQVASKKQSEEQQQHQQQQGNADERAESNVVLREDLAQQSGISRADRTESQGVAEADSTSNEQQETLKNADDHLASSLPQGGSEEAVDSSKQAEDEGATSEPDPRTNYLASATADSENAGSKESNMSSNIKYLSDEISKDGTSINERQHSSPSHKIGTNTTKDRDLPAPPTPSKEEEKTIYSDKAQMAEVAKAFDVGINVSDTSTQAKSLSKSSEFQKSLSADSTIDSPKTPRSGGLKIGKGPPPTTQASEEKPFDFNRFLDQMRHKSAGPVGEYVRSFIKGFTKKPYRVSDQTKLIFDFLDFISIRMRECEVWSKLNSTEFENATEAMEKLLMNRLYNFTFSPAVRKEGKWSVQTDDLERDRVLKQRIRLFGWISEEHLDVPIGSHSKGFIDFAIEELLKINHYKAPRDKVICILNCCKVIFGLIRHLSSEENADTFIPILIFVVLKANPDHLISNVEYISRFRNPEKLSSESGYYLSSLMGAVAFIETMDCTSLSNITQEQFEANVEKAVEKISAQPESVHSSPTRNNQIDHDREKSEIQSLGQSSSTFSTIQGSSTNEEESARSLQMSAGAAALAEDTKAFLQRTGEAARAGIGASLGKPIGALGRLFQESLVEGPRTPGGTSPLPVSGRATPETPPVTAGSSTSISARSRMWGLFGVDGDELQSKQQQSNTIPRSISSSSSLNFGNWSRSMREEEEEPQTPVTEELKQGRFANLLDKNQQQTLQESSTNLESQFAVGNAAPRVQRQQRYIPQRTDSIDPYSSVNDDDGIMASGVRTPDGDGSDLDNSSPTQATQGGRSRFSDLSGFLPSFLSEQNNTTTTTAVSTNTPRSASNPRQRSQQSTHEDILLDNEEAAIATAQIEQAHLTAGVETLKSIFPDVDPSVSRLILEDCQGDLRRTIDKLLEM